MTDSLTRFTIAALIPLTLTSKKLQRAGWLHVVAAVRLDVFPAAAHANPAAQH
ncbi:hypothetical protein BRCON_1891 [Candidatus Sumerlaea chitinivorans]|uniref:Uncharacterized protein n=1 Tax=Sumerlaea chitinivorans TaxID=2250252 RepID=A0A2Z4Y766_SUMC1|nr:hypothetical protein BRCON_1891 [Candidatus Sumerlaea chitinivorans]